MKNIDNSELCEMGLKYKTDKPSHGYTKIYYDIMKDFKYNNIDIFEIGIYMGASLKMWNEFFPNGKIYGIDNGRITPGTNVHTGKSNEFPSSDDIKLLQSENIIDNISYKWIENEKIKCYTADQRSEKQLNKAFKYFNCNKFDFIIDDGHHFQEHQQKSLGLLFPNVKPNGYYIIEDIATYESLLNGNYWGQKKKNALDSTDYIFSNFIKFRKLESIYMTFEQIEYITQNIEMIFLYDNTNSSIVTDSKLLIIKKRG